MVSMLELKLVTRLLAMKHNMITTLLTTMLLWVRVKEGHNNPIHHTACSIRTRISIAEGALPRNGIMLMPCLPQWSIMNRNMTKSRMR